MDLIYMNKNKEDVGVMKNFTLDLAFGFDENNFELTTNMNNHVCREGFIIYMEGTEYGGIIDSIKVVTETEQLSYLGRTWHGILESKVLTPDEGQDYLICNGEANSVLQELVGRMGLETLFSASVESSGLFIRNYKMNRYIEGYSGIKKMLASVGAKLKIEFHEGFCILSAERLIDYSQDDEFDSSQIDFDIIRNYRPVNHIICLGQGELNERTVIDLYADTNGNISKIQTIFGLDEVVQVYENVNAESDEELEEGGRELLEQLLNSDELNVDLDSAKNYDIADIVGARENVTGIFLSRPIIKKIVTIKDDIVTIQYKVGE